MNFVDLRLRREDKSSATAIIFHCFSVLHVSFSPVLPQYNRLSQSTNYTADVISIAYFTATLKGKNLM